MGNARSTVLAIDPAMGCTGFAVLMRDRRHPAGGLIIDAGAIKIPDGPAFLPRLTTLTIDIEDIAAAHLDTLEAIVVETPLTITPGMGRSRSATSLPSYGIAVGAALLQASIIADTLGGRVQAIETSASAWSKGQESVKDDKYKQARVARVRLLFGNSIDLGPKTTAGNVADAILIASWYLLNHPAPHTPNKEHA